MSETKAAFSELTKWSLENILYRYMADYGYKYISKIVSICHNPEFQKKCSIDLIPKNIKNSDFLSIQYSKPLREYRKLKFKYADRYRISNYDLPFRNGWKPQFTKEVLEIVAISSRKPPTYTIKNEQGESNGGKFYEKDLIKLI